MLKKIVLRCALPTASGKISIYLDTDVASRGLILYFHGGGLLFGSRDDLPQIHKELITKAGYMIAAYDYYLAPEAKIDEILNDVRAYIREMPELIFAGNLPPENFPAFLSHEKLPVFLWGRSAGAYLCLLSVRSECIPAPSGIISYYGYGLLTDGWFDEPSPFYLSLPQVNENCMQATQIPPSDVLRYSRYVYARQNGAWLNLIHDGKKKTFYRDFTLRLTEKLPCPLFCCHAMHDDDVPYAEFMALNAKYLTVHFTAASHTHDFDRDENSPVTVRLLNETLKFLDKLCGC